MDGTAAINRKRGEWRRKEKRSREERCEMTEIKRGREEGRKRGRMETERKQVGEGTKKRDIGVSSPCKWWHSPCSYESSRNVFFSLFLEKKADEAVPGLLWHDDEHPTLSLCQSHCIPRPWQQLLATSSSCVKSAYVLMNVSTTQSCHCCVRFNSPPRAKILPEVYLCKRYARLQIFQLEQLCGPRLCSSSRCQI